MKKILTFLLISFTLTIVCNSLLVIGESELDESSSSFNVGDYILLGKYSGKSILWRYVANDINGMLMLSDKTLCNKRFGSTNFWSDSPLRRWLNSDSLENETEWGFGYESVMVSPGSSPWEAEWEERTMPYDMEKGFLNQDNFSLSERRTMKMVAQWTMIPEDHIDLSANGKANVYNPVKGMTEHRGMIEPSVPIYCDISELPEYYSGAAHQVTDTVFLLDEMQIYQIWCNFGKTFQALVSTFVPESHENPSAYYWMDYYLRTPVGNVCTRITPSGNYDSSYSTNNYGIRPAFYLDEDNAMILSGSGTAEDPFVVTGKEIMVSLDGTDLAFDQLPMIKDGIVLVPLRTIFETLGAEVGWDETTQTVTATKGSDKIILQIGSSTLTKNATDIDLGYPAVLEGDRTMIPLNAISESFSIPVDWNPNTLQATITTG